MKQQTIIVDWLKDVVEAWFNSQNLEGGFISSVTKYNLYNNLTDIGVITVYADGGFQKPPLKREVRKWFRGRLKRLVKEINKEHEDCRILVVNGCTPQQDITGRSLDMLKAYVNLDKDRWINDEDALIRLTGRFKTHFINESPTILFPEPFFNVYLDDLWKYCKDYVEQKKVGMTFIAPGNFPYGWLIGCVGEYFPKGTVVPYVPKGGALKDPDDAGLVVLRESMEHFSKMFFDAGIAKPELTETQKSVVAIAKEELKQELAKAI